MTLRRSIGTLTLLVLASACGAEPTSPDLEPRMAAVGGGGPAASGSGHVDFGDGLRVFTFHAKEMKNGSAKGSYRIHLTSLGLFFEVDVTCVSTEGSTAWVAGIISDSNADFIEIGSVSYFYAIDNGEGAGSPPDVVSTARINDVAGEDLAFCRDQILLLPSFPIQYGNVQVR